MSLYQVDVLIVVDVEGALTGGLTKNVFLVDTNGYVGSGNEGSNELKTTVQDGTVINWRVQAIQPDNQVNIENFTGQAVSDGTIGQPRKYGGVDGFFFQSRVEQRSGGQYQYSINLNMEGKILSFDPFLEVNEPGS